MRCPTALVLIAACQRTPSVDPPPRPSAIARAFAAPSASSAAPVPVVEPVLATVDAVAVPHDQQAYVVRGSPGTRAHIVFMAGLCSSVYWYLAAFPEAARAHGGVLALEGDQPCPEMKGFHSYTWSPVLQRSRIESALAAAGMTIPSDGLTLVGYSAGASIAELMHRRWPDAFPRLVLIAPPIDPVTESLRKASGIVAMSCSLDVPYRMKAAHQSLTKLGVSSTYIEMPKCTHGNIADGERVFSEAFDWLDARPLQ
jgi:pimeloyl-ACP methyl ester carboxylesterase